MVTPGARAKRCMALPGLLVASALTLLGCPTDSTPTPPERPATAVAPGAGGRPVMTDADRAKALRFACTACHRLPPADALPKFAWDAVVDEMYDWAELGEGEAIGVPRAWAKAHFRRDAPERFLTSRGAPTDTAARDRFARTTLRPKGAPNTPAVSHVSLVDLFGDARLELVVCDMRHGLVLFARPGRDAELRPVGVQLGHPSHAEVCDLDGDGWKDLVVTDLGDFNPGDHKLGRVLWLRRVPQKNFELHVLARGLARPSDVRAFDADGDGDLDLAVAAFGWRKEGAVLLLRNEGVPSPSGKGGSEGPRSAQAGKATPRFVVETIDPTPGAVDVPAVDLDGDGRTDLVYVLAQRTEAVRVAWGRPLAGAPATASPTAPAPKLVSPVRLAAPVTLFDAPHPGWGSNGVVPADLDGDGDIDLVTTNGDTLDDHLLKPYHAVRWLEQTADGFAPRLIGALHGVHDAQVADVDGDGDLDVLATSFLPQVEPAVREALRLEAVVWFEQGRDGGFARRVIESRTAQHATLAVGDYDLDGDMDFVVGWFTMAIGERDRIDPWVTIWTQK